MGASVDKAEYAAAKAIFDTRVLRDATKPNFPALPAAAKTTPSVASLDLRQVVFDKLAIHLSRTFTGSIRKSARPTTISGAESLPKPLL